jgi:hypothetical protein
MSTNSILARATIKALTAEHAPAPKQRRSKGYKLVDEGRRAPSVHVLLTDAQVLECRSRFEFERGWALERLAAEYGTSRDYMRQLLSYQTRSKLIPRRPA